MTTVLLFILLIFGTACLIFWNVLLFASDESHSQEITSFAYRKKKEKFNLLYEKYLEDAEALKNLSGIMYTLRKMFHDPQTSEKQAGKLQKEIEDYEQGNKQTVNVLMLPGFGFLKMFSITADMKLFSNLMSLIAELKGREYAAYDTRYSLAAMVSCALGGSGITVLLGFMFAASGNAMIGWILAGSGPLLSVLVAGSVYSDIQDKFKKRRAEIIADFPQVVSEIALLTSSGLEIFRAWDEVSKDRPGALYREMRMTSKELENGFLPSIAFEAFIRRCGTKETTRLGASILQNLTRGNAELSRFLTELSREAWEERKNHARQLGAQAQSKLMLPMFIIFFGIILMIAVPAALSMTGMGF